MCRCDRWGYSTPHRIPMGFGSYSDVSAFLRRNAPCLPQRGEGVAGRLFARLIAFEPKRFQNFTPRKPDRAFLDYLEDALLAGTTRSDTFPRPGSALVFGGVPKHDGFISGDRG